MSSFYLRKYDVFSWTENKRGLFELSNAYGCYSCGLWVCRDAVRTLRELNGGRIFHPAFDGTWGDEDNFLADELGYSGFRIGYSTRVRLAGSFGDCSNKKKFDGFTANFIKRIGLRHELLGADA